MNTEQTCHRVLLADEEACRVLYCQHCNVAEVSIGAVSLRFYPESLRLLVQGLAHALQGLEQLQQPVAVPLPVEWQSSENVH